MNDKQALPALEHAVEPMIDARQASYALRLPYYWFADPKMRSAKRIPHYQLSRLVRFRLSELAAWHRQNAERHGGQGNEMGDGNE